MSGSDAADNAGTIALRTSDVLATLGVGVHLSDTAGPYGNISLVSQELQYLGIDSVRDTDPQTWTVSNYVSLAETGVQMDLIEGKPGENLTTSSIASDFAMIDQIEAAVPGSIIGIEGLNEPYNYPVDYNGSPVESWSELVAVQDAIEAQAASDSLLAGVPILASSINTGDFPGPAPDLGGSGEIGNAHVYPPSGDQPGATMASAVGDDANLVDGDPVWITEFGYSTTPGDSSFGVDQATQAKNILNGLADSFAAGVSHIFLYELNDELANIPSDDAWAATGLFNSDGSAKLAATAIHNFTSILADNGAEASDFQVGTLSYAITGMPSTAHSLLLEKSDGTFQILIWNEAPDWNPATQSAIAVAPVTVTVTIDGTPVDASLYDPMVGTDAIDEYGTANQVLVTLTDHPVVLQLAPEDKSSSAIAANRGNAFGAVADGPPCFCEGTRIATLMGETPVEALQVGDFVRTASGEVRPIRWIGRRSYDGRFIAGNRDVLPIVFSPDSLGDGIPVRALAVSPKHAMFLDGVLIPAEALVNGTSIVQRERVETLTYYHVELARHDILLAEGAPSESFVDDDSRGRFQNAAEFAALYPQAIAAPARFCAPRVEDGEAVERVRLRIAARYAPVAAAPGALRGYLDSVSRGEISGWAMDEAAPDQVVRLRILDNGVAIAELDADTFRADLAQAGCGQGRHGFRLIVPGGLSPSIHHVIDVQRVTDGCRLEQSPRLLEPTEAVLAVLPRAAARGWLDVATRDQVSGWASDDDQPDVAVALVILDNGVPVARVLANRFRADLADAGIGRGRSSFVVVFPGGLEPLERHVIAVRREYDGIDLPNSPIVIEAAESFDAAVEEAVARAVDAVGSDGEARRVLSFLTAQAERLRREQADRDVQRIQRAEHRRLRGAQAVVPGAPAPRALVIDSRMPCVRRDADALAIPPHLRAIRGLGYAVGFVAADEMAASENSVAALAAAGFTHWGAPVYASVEQVLQLQSDSIDVVYLHGADIAARYLALARHYAPTARIVGNVTELHRLHAGGQPTIAAWPELRLAASAGR